MRQAPALSHCPSSHVHCWRSPPISVCAVPRRTVHTSPPTRSRASRIWKSYPSRESSYPSVSPDSPAPSTSTFAFFGRPESAGRLPASPAIKSQDESAVITSDEPPTAPRWPRKRRRVSAKAQLEDRVAFMLESKSAGGDEIASILSQSRRGQAP